MAVKLHRCRSQWVKLSGHPLAIRDGRLDEMHDKTPAAGTTP